MVTDSDLKPVRNIDDPRYVKALSHPLRVRVLALLQERDSSPVELAKMLDVKLGVVSYHVKTLRDYGLVELVEMRQRRGAVEHVYRVKERPQLSDDAWGDAPPVAKQAYVASFLSTVRAYTDAAAAAGGFDRKDAHFTRTVAPLDEKGWKALGRAYERFLGQVDKAIADADGRIASGETERHMDAGVVLMLFEATRLTGPRQEEENEPKPLNGVPRLNGDVKPV